MVLKQIFIATEVLLSESWKSLMRQSRIIQVLSASIQVHFAHYSDHFRAFYYRALCFEKIGHYAMEEKDFRKAIEIQPNNVNALYHLASLR